MTKKEARAYFREKGLTYSDITLSDLRLLNVLLNRQITMRRELEYWTRVNLVGLTNSRFDEQGRLIFAHMTGKGEDFTARETISFDADGFIGFCGAADSKNSEPVLAGFVEWCDIMAELKEFGEGGDDDGGS